MPKREPYSDPKAPKKVPNHPFPKAGEKPQPVEQPINPTSHGQLRQETHRTQHKN